LSRACLGKMIICRFYTEMPKKTVVTLKYLRHSIVHHHWLRPNTQRVRGPAGSAFSLDLSCVLFRACLGKSIIFEHKMAQPKVFSAPAHEGWEQRG
jgi:hypothetical protein